MVLIVIHFCMHVLYMKIKKATYECLQISRES